MTLLDKLERITELQTTIQLYGKLSDEVLKKINYKFRLEWNYTSNNMEGNSLTRQETRSIMVGNITIEGKPIKDVWEMKGHDEVINDILKLGQGELNISEKRIKEIHKAIIHEEDPKKQKQVGEWKIVPNYLYNYKKEKFEFIPPAEVPNKMHELINWLNAEKEKIERRDPKALDPVIIAFKFHLDYITIHPFYDGNGRTARILTNLILISYGFPPIYIKEIEKPTYYQYLADIQGYGGEPDLFYEFMADTLIRSQELVLDAIKGKEIKEPDDWERELLLFKKERSNKEGVKQEKRGEVILDLVYKTVIPFLKILVSKLDQFADLFAKKEMYFGNKYTSSIVKSIAEIEKENFREDNKYWDSIAFSYRLYGFKKDGTNTFQNIIDLRWELDQYIYSFFINHSDSDRAIRKLYHQNFSEEEMEAFANECANQFLINMQKKLEIPRKN